MSACIKGTDYVKAAEEQATAIRSQALWDVAIQTAIALYQRNSSNSISQMQENIANRHMRLAEQLRAHAELFWPEEREFVDDAFGEQRHTTDYASSSNVFGLMADQEFNAAREDWLEAARSMCLPPSPCEDARWARHTQLARADLISYAARREESHTEALNDRRAARQYAALQLGRDNLSAITSFNEAHGSIRAPIAQLQEGILQAGAQIIGIEQYNRRRTAWGRSAESWLTMPDESYARRHSLADKATTTVINLPAPATAFTPPKPFERTKLTEGDISGQPYLYDILRGPQ